MSENQNRKPYTRETWPGYRWVRIVDQYAIEDVDELGAATSDAMWSWKDLAEDPPIYGSHDGKTWFPCYEGGEASAVPAERVPTPDDAADRSAAENARLSDLFQKTLIANASVNKELAAAKSERDGLQSHLSHAQKMLATVVERSRKHSDELTAELAVERMKATQAESVSAELLRVNAELKSELAAVKSQRDRLLALHDHKDQRISDIVAERDRLQSELADERRWQERLRELWDNTNGKCIPVLLTNRVAGGNTWDVIDRFEKTFKVLGRGPTPAAAVDAAAKALGVTFEDEQSETGPCPICNGSGAVDSGGFTENGSPINIPCECELKTPAAPQVDSDECGTPQLFTASKQDGIPGHCVVAQVFGPDGNAVAKFTPTADPEVASRHAKLCAETLNRHYDSVSNRPAPRTDSSGRDETVPLSSQPGDLIVRRNAKGDFLLILDGRYVNPDVRWNQIGRIYEWMIDGSLEWAETPEDHARDDAFIREMIARNPVKASPQVDSATVPEQPPRFTLTPNGCGVLDRERPGMVCPFGGHDKGLRATSAQRAMERFTDGQSNPADYGWVTYTPPETAAPEPETLMIKCSGVGCSAMREVLAAEKHIPHWCPTCKPNQDPSAPSVEQKTLDRLKRITEQMEAGTYDAKVTTVTAERPNPQVGEIWVDGYGKLIGPLESTDRDNAYFKTHPLSYQGFTYMVDGRYVDSETHSEADLVRRVDSISEPNQEQTDGQQQVGGSGDGRGEDRSPDLDAGQVQCETCVQRVADVVEQSAGSVSPAPHSGDVTQNVMCQIVCGTGRILVLLSKDTTGTYSLVFRDTGVDHAVGSYCREDTQVSAGDFLLSFKNIESADVCAEQLDKLIRTMRGELTPEEWDANPGDSLPSGANPPLNEDSPPLKPQSPPFSEDSPPSDNPPLVIEVGGRYLCRDGVTTAEVVGKSNIVNAMYPFIVLLRNTANNWSDNVTSDGLVFDDCEDPHDLIRRLPDVVTVEVDPEAVAMLKDQGLRPVAYRYLPDGVSYLSEDGYVRSEIEFGRFWGLTVEPIPADDTTGGT